MKQAKIMGALAVAIASGLIVSLTAQEAAPTVKDAAKAPADVTCSMSKAAPAVAKPQTLCPIMGGKCNKDIFVDVEGVRICGCCQDCLAKIKADPKAALAKIKANGEQAECVCVVCPKCGEFQGSKKCCQPDAVKCDKCKMDKGSPGCCKPDVLGKTIACGMDPVKCTMKAAAPVAPAVTPAPAATPAPAVTPAPVAAPAK